MLIVTKNTILTQTSVLREIREGMVTKRKEQKLEAFFSLVDVKIFKKILIKFTLNYLTEYLKM